MSQLLDALGAGDALVVWRLDRLARDFTDMLEVLAQVLLAGVWVLSLQDDLDSERMGSVELNRIVKALLSHKSHVEAERALAERIRRLDASGDTPQAVQKLKDDALTVPPAWPRSALHRSRSP